MKRMSWRCWEIFGGLLRDLLRTGSNPLLVRRGGRDIKKNIAKPPLLERMGAKRKRDSAQHQEWSLTQAVSVSDHPVCGAKEASRHFVTAAATPPHEEGSLLHPK